VTLTEIVLATRNPAKAEEIRRIFHGSGIRLRTLEDFPGCPAVAEDGPTFEENAVRKAVAVARATGRAALADDSGLEVDALGGAPGVRSARYAGEMADDRMNLERLLHELRQVGEAKRRARFVCCLALAFPHGAVRTFRGCVEGSLAMVPRGERGFGYDPIFSPTGSSRTFAEMASAEKDAISHRGIALRALWAFLVADPDRPRATPSGS
jgi:XTP/dITP diphosphohydrolase